MTFIVIIASVFLDRVVDAGKSLRSLSFINRWLDIGLTRVQGNHMPSLLLLLLVMLVPATLVYWIGEWVEDLGAPLMFIGRLRCYLSALAHCRLKLRSTLIYKRLNLVMMRCSMTGREGWLAMILLAIQRPTVWLFGQY